MNRSTSLLEQRRAYIRERLNKATCTRAEVQRLSGELFISETTVYRDFVCTTEQNIDKRSRTL
jgi:DeoR/GlpR family transcriptional regulator of sugar metabolism